MKLLDRITPDSTTWGDIIPPGPENQVREFSALSECRVLRLGCRSGLAGSPRGSGTPTVAKLVFVLVSILLATPILAIARNPNTARGLEGKNPAANVDAIVLFQHAPIGARQWDVFARGGALRIDLGQVKAGQSQGVYTGIATTGEN